MQPLIRQAVEETFYRRAVPAITLAAHRADHPVLFQPCLKDVARILASPGGVTNQTRRRFLVEPRHRQRINHDVHRHPELDRPADDFPVEQIEGHGQVEPILVGPDVGHVGGPDLIRFRQLGVQIQPARRNRQRMLRVRRRLEA